MSRPAYACSRCGNALPSPPPEAGGWTCDEINDEGKTCGGLPRSVGEVQYLDCPECGEATIPASRYDEQGHGRWSEHDPERNCYQCGARLRVNIDHDEDGRMGVEARVIEDGPRLVFKPGREVLDPSNRVVTVVRTEGDEFVVVRFHGTYGATAKFTRSMLRVVQDAPWHEEASWHHRRR